MATFALLHALIAAVASDIISGVSLKPPVIRITVLRAGIELRLLARSFTAYRTSRAQKLAICALIGGALASDALGATAENLIPLTTFFSRCVSSVKFCAICNAPPKLAIAISRFGPPLLSMNLVAACRARA